MKSLLLFPSAILLLLLPGPLSAATTTGHQGAVPVLLGLDSVRKELGLTKSQCDQLDKIRSAFKSDARLITTRPPVTQVERSAANSTVKTLMTRYNDKAVAVLTPQQHARLVQIERQTLGGLMLFQPDEQKLLGLTAEQIASLGKIRSNGEAFASRVTNLFEKGDLTLQERLTTLRNYRVKESAKALRVLSPKQRKAFISLQGTKLKRG